jgi:osmotically-inducible protein OsmY
MDLHIPGSQRNASVRKRAERAAESLLARGRERLEPELRRGGARIERELGRMRAQLRETARIREARAQTKRLRAEARLAATRARLLAARAGGGEAWSAPKQIAIGLGGIAAGAAGVYFLDRRNGKRRRHDIRDKAASFARSRGADLRRAVEYRKGQAAGVAHRATPQGDDREFDDLTLADKVRSEALRPRDVPAGAVNVNVEEGVVFLRGEIEDQERIEQLVQATLAVEGVTSVESLLHLPGEQAPTKGEGVVVKA